MDDREVDIDWRNIRPYGGSREKGFEELCAQLARDESPKEARFERKGTPDAGVECFSVLSDGSEWGWQAKYLDVLGDSQWSQLQKSVKTALKRHPRLTRYFICIPVDRADARVAGKKSAMEKWEEYVEKWVALAAAQGRSVDFVYWGSHELLYLLTRPKHIGRIQYWFDTRSFDSDWFAARLDEALKTAGPRYTPEIHVDLPIAQEFEAFGRTEHFFERVTRSAKSIRDGLRSVRNSEALGDKPVDEAMAIVAEKVRSLATALATIDATPVGPLPFHAILEQLRAAEIEVESLARLLLERERDRDARRRSQGERPTRPDEVANPFRDRRTSLYDLVSELRSTRELLSHADAVANSSLMLLCGNAGTGKTHLLCDVASQRISEGRPTILLMGQRFLSNEEPWSQVLQQLDLGAVSAAVLVGALEAAAQAAGARAFLIVDALNEGAGRTIWPSHLEAFLAHLVRSPWIGVILSVRSSYKELVVPEQVRNRAVAIAHEGFNEHEYDATRTFFLHYGLEFPSTPLLAPEFRNPLFLKTLCLGLAAKGERHLPRGFHGITAVFDLYLTSVNDRIAGTVGFDARAPLVRRALEALVGLTLDVGQSWLTVSRAAELVEGILPGKDYERSLYRALVTEGVLIEEAPLRLGQSEEVVLVAYERFSDHLTAKGLLDRHLDPGNPAAAFGPGGGLSFISQEKYGVSPGLLEALCIQVPERTGQEITDVAPRCLGQWGLGDAFRQSVVWRSYSAFSDSTKEALNRLCQTEHDLRDTLDALVTVATLSEHPFNARFLDGRLRKDSMAERDAWWSTYLHEAWGRHSPVDRLVDWASRVSPSTAIEEETLDLCVIALSWMLSSSNRTLRDRATKALVVLLSEHFAAASRLLEKFAEVDDLYVLERVYSVAYGLALRSADPIAVGTLATKVYTQVFEQGSPPPHILLRDYARGVIERALYLESPITVIPDCFRPPYKSDWPAIPTEKDIEPLRPDWSRGSRDSRELEWARNHIGASVMEGDFGRYVIGTNSFGPASDWLSLRLDEPPWAPPPRPMELLRSLVSEFSIDERKAWDEVGAAVLANATASQATMRSWFGESANEGDPADLSQAGADVLALEAGHLPTQEPASASKRAARGAAILDGTLTASHAERLRNILAAMGLDHDSQRPPRFDLRQVQRYILWRVFDLGWTTERFGHFDRFSAEYDIGDGSRSERIGKKYQWIAYHEILALLSDHFQYREQFEKEEVDQRFAGPWLDHVRDIDPSCTLASTPGGTSWSGHVPAWWGSLLFGEWGSTDNPGAWIKEWQGLPKVEDLLVVTNPADGSVWLNCQGHFAWKLRTPSDQEPMDTERRELWCSIDGYLLRGGDADAFLEWAEGVNLSGRWMPDGGETYRMFLGEHAWSPAYRHIQKQYRRDDGWVQPTRDCPVRLRATTFEYAREAGGLDRSIQESYRLRLPMDDLVTGLRVRWSSRGADFVDSMGRVVVQDPTAHADGPTALLILEESLREFLRRERLTFCWVVRGEKRVLSPGLGDGPYHTPLQISGAYTRSEATLRGFVNYNLEEQAGGSVTLLGQRRCPS